MTTVLTPQCTVLIGESLTVVPDSGEVTLDETDTYATADFTFPLVDEASVDAIDPRTGVRAVITLRMGSTVRNLDLGIRERTVSHDRKTVRIVAGSDELLLDDYARLSDLTFAAGYKTDLRGLVNSVLATVIPGAALQPGSNGSFTEDDALTWPAGTTAWEYLLPLVSAAGFRLFCDELRVWRMVPTAYMLPGVVTVQPSNTAEGEDTLSRDGQSWVTGVVIRYRWTAADGTAKERIDNAGVAGKVDVYDVDGRYPGAGFAQARLNRLKGQGRTQTATAVTGYTESPGQEIRFDLPGTASQIGRVQSVSWPLLTGFASFTARELTEISPAAWLYLPVGEGWDDSPVGASWTGEVV